MKVILLIGAGGFVGSVARYYLSRLNLTANLFSLPVGTLLVNIAGSFLIGLLAALAIKEMVSEEMRLFLMVGLCGGFTTFSAFTNENMTLIQNGQIHIALLYVSISIIVGLTAVFLGYRVADLI